MRSKELPFDLEVYGHTDIGLVRKRNEDVWGQIPEWHFFLVADGMGGHLAGDVAARQAVDWCCHTFMRVLGPEGQEREDLHELAAVLRFVVKDANKRIYQMASLDEAHRGMGTTLACAYFHDDSLIYAHVGDSRLYRMRNDGLEQLTEDHSLVRRLVDVIGLKEEEAVEQVGNHVITKALGKDPYVDPSLDCVEVESGDLFLLATDGLTDLIGQEEIEKVLLESEDPRWCVHTLIDAAKEAGGQDNITAVVIRVKEKKEE